MVTRDVDQYSKQLKKLGIENRILEHPHLVKPIEVVTRLGYTLSDSAATLIMVADGNFIAVIRRDDRKVSFKKIKKLLNVKDLRIAMPKEFVKVTGLQVGTARFYIPNLKTIIDSGVFEKKHVLGGTGSFSHTLRCKSEDLKKLPNSTIEDVSEKEESPPEATPSGIKRVLSGIRATGRLHLGNYLGAVKGMLELQSDADYETFYMVADVHTITTPFSVEELRKNRREVIIDYLAAGLDPEKSTIFQQSEVKEHIELAFYFSSVTTIARMQHLPTFKEKVKQYPKNVTMALLNYPVLMAADILVYKAGLVPVGIDQEPHLEVTREIARKMNQLYGTDFPEPKRFATKGEYIPSLKGEGKMSKSVEGSYINLTDSLEEIRRKIRSVPTATQAGGAMSSGVKTLFTLIDLFLSQQSSKFKQEYDAGRLQFIDLKDALTDAIFKELQPIQEKRLQIESDQGFVDKVIKDGAEKARSIASQTVKEVRRKMGLL